MKEKTPECCKINTVQEKELFVFNSLLSTINDKNRLRIICMLQQKESCVCDIYKNLNLPQNLVSYHLGVLEKVEIVSQRREGLKVFYSINKKGLKKIRSLFDKFIVFYE